MCAINGIVSRKNIGSVDQRILYMNKSTTHRGPDHSSYCVSHEETAHFAFGHNRLKIIDLTKQSNQPMVGAGVTIVFNGEIYNFKELRKELRYNFKSKGDTEVILAAYIEKGIDWFLENANGIFAVAIYDKNTNDLILTKDRFGVKPLYFYKDDEKVIFSSEIKGILNSGLIEPVFNDAAVDLYLANRYIYEPYTFFKNIHQVQAAHYIKFNFNSSISQSKRLYWKLPKLNFETEYNEEEILVKVDTLLNQAVERQMVSDVPLGTYLSGGLDSSLLTALAARKTAENIQTYTTGFDIQDFNEFEFSDIVAQKYQTNHKKISLDADIYLKKWAELISRRDAPLSVPNEVAIAVMSTELKKTLTVVLSGEGADELFGGYGKIFRTAFYTQHNNKEFYEHFINTYEYISRDFRDKYFILDTSLRLIIDEENKDMFSDVNDEEKIFRFFHARHLKGLLQRLDIATMQAGVEGRVPFLDYDLFDFVYEYVPYDLKLKWKSEEQMESSKHKQPEDYSEKNDTPKYALKRVAEKYLPNEIIYRKKVGFPVPLTNWFDLLITEYTELLSQADWIKQDKLKELIYNAKNDTRAGQIIWMVINVELFKKYYFNQTWKW